MFRKYKLKAFSFPHASGVPETQNNKTLVYEPKGVLNNDNYKMTEETSLSSLAALVLSQCLET
jgi:hypothetical protein